ncbi:MAG: oligopeptide/dipeptide ABC transporter ATP-binding protein [Hyphomicrobiales bacterium]
MTALLELAGIEKQYPARDGHGVVRAVDGVSLALNRGQTLGIVGESGCGKSTLARVMLRLIDPTAGTIRFDGEDITRLSARELKRVRRDMQIVFQDPYASLDPRMTVGDIVSEPLDIHGIGTRSERKAKVLELLSLVGLDEAAAKRYPHEFSGGQRQRIGIARAIALEPKLVVLDEPVSALDVSIQSQVLNLLSELKERLRLSYVFISHDLSVVEYMSDEVAVMYLGRVVERGPAEALLRAPKHPYTQALVSSVPEPDPDRRAQRIILKGDPPNPEHIPAGCRFHPRCPKAFGNPCEQVMPKVSVAGESAVECHLYDPAFAP